MTIAPTHDRSHVVHGTCPHDCPDSCGWQVTVRDGQAVQMRGNPAHPFSAGELCPKVNRFLDRVHDPARVLHPLRRVGPKGAGQFEQITWDEALSEIAERFGAAIATHGAESIVPYSDAGNQSLLAIHFPNRFWNELGGSRLVRALCGPTVGAGVTMTNGTGLALDPMEIRHSKLIILWATNTKLTNRHLWPTIEAARAAGARLVVIDCLRTITADAADWFVQPLPGTDTALMLAMMHVLIRDGLVDQDWIDQHTTGFAELADHVADWTPERAAEVCGVDAADIESLATEYGTTRPAVIRTLIGGEHHENGAMLFRTMAVLPALVGAWRDKGGGLARSVGSWADQLIDHHAIDRPDLCHGALPRELNMSTAGQWLNDPGLDPPVAALVVWNANPMVSTPDVEGIRRGLLRDDLFVVCHEQFVTDTARFADLILPATTQVESVDVTPAWGHLWLGWNEPAIEPRGEAVSNSEFHRRLAAAMGMTHEAHTHDDMTVLRDALPSVNLDELREVGWVRVPYPTDGRPYADGQFPTTSGKVQLWSEPLVALGLPGLPTYIPAAEGPGTAQAARFPFQLMTPKHHQRFLNTSYSHLPNHGGREHGPYVEICATDAAALGVAEGDQVEVFNDRGCVPVPVRIGQRVRPGVVMIPWGWWGSATTNGQVANSLTNATLTEWGGGVAYSDTLVDIRPAPTTGR